MEITIFFPSHFISHLPNERILSITKDLMLRPELCIVIFFMNMGNFGLLHHDLVFEGIIALIP